MNNPEKGHLIEMYVKTKLTELGYELFYPTYSGSIVDLILKKGSNLYKVQIKQLSKDNDTYTIHTKSTRLIQGKYMSVTYPKSEIDFFIGYNIEDKLFVALENNSEVEASLTRTFRSNLPKQGQIKNINLLKDYDLEKFLNDLGNNESSSVKSYEDRLTQTKDNIIRRQENRDKLNQKITEDKKKQKALSRVGISGFIGVGLKDIRSDGTKVFQATIRPKAGDKQINILIQTDPIKCAKAYDKYVIENGLDKPTNEQLGLL